MAPSTPLPSPDTDLRFFVGYGEVAGYFGNLSAGLSQLGHQVTCVDLAGHGFGYDAAEAHRVGWIDLLCRASARVLGGRDSGRSLRRAVWVVVSEVARWIILAGSVRSHDVFVLSGTRASTAGYELPLLRRLGKKVILVFNGTDARPAYLGSAHHPPTGPVDAEALIARSRALKARIRRLERHADEIVCHATCIHFFTRPIVKSMLVGIPTAPVELAAEHPARPPEHFRVLHAPSNPVVKGTAAIREAVQQARSVGFEIELVEISGRPHQEVLREIAASDLVCDQLYSDTPMAGLAAEAAQQGVASLIGGYELEDVCERDIGVGRVPPSFTCLPDDYADALVAVLRAPDRLESRGRQAQAFVQTHWRREVVAGRYVDLARGRWDDADRRRPAEIRYVHGVGLSEDRTKEMIRAVVARGGPSALQVDDHPELRACLVAFGAAS